MKYVLVRMDGERSFPTHIVIDGPFRWRWMAEAMANHYRADEAQRARHDGDATRKIDVIPYEPTRGATR